MNKQLNFLSTLLIALTIINAIACQPITEPSNGPVGIKEFDLTLNSIELFGGPGGQPQPEAEQATLASSNDLKEDFASNSLATLITPTNLLKNKQPNIISKQAHERKILDDAFEIIKESKFSTNNHLGSKGVPKFGSEQDYRSPL